METEIAHTDNRISPNVEIDADLAEILELLSSMVSSLGEIETYFQNFSVGIRLLSGVDAVYVWQAFERGDEQIYLLVNNPSQLDVNANDPATQPFIHDLASLANKKIARSVSDLPSEQLLRKQLRLADDLDSFMTFPIMHQDQMLGLVMLVASNQLDFPEPVMEGLDSLVSASAVFLHNANLLKDVRTLFHDLDFMIQEWIKDVSGRLDKVQQSESLLGKILSDLSHEFRTPIASLNLYSGLIQKRPENQTRYLDTMQVELSRLEQILEGVLELSEFNVFSSKNQLQPIHVFSFFERYKNHFNSALNNFDINLNYDLSPSSCLVMANEEYLFRSLLQLVLNSAKYGNGSDINISAEKGMSEDGIAESVIIRVIDKGPGISSSDIPHIFNPFYRGEGVGQSTIFGVGLGLTFAREIIQFFGGTLSLLETGSEGTTMEVRLPMITDH